MNEKNTVSETNHKREERIKSLRHMYVPDQTAPNLLLDATLLASDYVAALVGKNPEMLDLFTPQQLQQATNEFWCETYLHNRLAQQEKTHESLQSLLRYCRHQIMARIIARMANGFSNTQETIAEASALALSFLKFVTQQLHTELCSKYGTPVDSEGNGLQLLIIAMGKLGGYELNVSSDIDLIFAYTSAGETQVSDQHQTAISNHLFFTRLGQKLIKILNERHEDGFVFRVDMRLRPYGNSGALVASLPELDKYYREQARQWERFALARARVVTGSEQEKNQLQHLIDGYVYRKYVDFSVIEDLRGIKTNIRQHTLRGGKERNIKLGAGGIRKVEFVAQVYQLIYGGKHGQFRSASTLEVLHHIDEAGYLEPTLVQNLQESYLFLRHVENYLQARNDQQTHSLPTSEENQQRLAHAMGYLSWDALNLACQQHRDQVQNIFDDFILGDTEELSQKKILDPIWQELATTILQHKTLPENTVECINTNNRNNLDELATAIDKTTPNIQQLYQQLLPFILHGSAQSTQPALALQRLVQLLEAIVRRSVYLSLLYENRSIIPILSYTLVMSDWLFQHLSQYPALLESYVHNKNNLPQPSPDQSFDTLRNMISGLPGDDEEQQVEAMRHFAREANFYVALAQLTERLSLRKVCDWLTYTAEACIDHALHLAWTYLIERHGAPATIDDGLEATGFAIIGYGKLGGFELSYTSDIDVVFVYNGTGSDMTTGKRPISVVQFYTRLAQRIIHILSTPTSAGKGYELDTRLRPQGSKGLLVNAISGLSKYLHQEAWTWEHQALVRSRAIAGDRATIEQFNQLRQDILTQKRDTEILRNDVLDMRKRIDQVKIDRDIKYGTGGLVDIEFLVQYLVLAWAHQYPDITRYSDNLRQIEALAARDVLSQQQKKTLIHAYVELRSAVHFLTLGVNDHGVNIAKLTAEVRDIQSALLSTD